MQRSARQLAIFFLLAAGFFRGTADGLCFKGDVAIDASSTGPVISWDREFRQSALVVIGKVVSVQRIPDPKEPDFWIGTLYQVRVEARLKGSPGDFVEVFSRNDSGRMILSRGRRYLLFLRTENGRLVADPCGNSAKLVYPF